MPVGHITVISRSHADLDNNNSPALPATAHSTGSLSLPVKREEIAMDSFNLFDPRYQLEAEEPPLDPALEDLPARVLIHEEIQLTLHALDHLAVRLRRRTEEEHCP